MGTVQETETLDNQFVRRSRSCNVCGHTWSTHELPSRIAKRLLALDKALSKIYAKEPTR
jgi:transcriptional regulator NrdR family protein